MLYYILYLASFLVAEIFILLFWNWYVRIHTMGKMSGLKNPGTYVVVILGTIIGNSSVRVISAEALRTCRESHTQTALFASYLSILPPLPDFYTKSRYKLHSNSLSRFSHYKICVKKWATLSSFILEKYLIQQKIMIHQRKIYTQIKYPQEVFVIYWFKIPVIIKFY